MTILFWSILFLLLPCSQSLGPAEFNPKLLAKQENLGEIFEYDDLMPIMVHSQWTFPLSQLWTIADKYLIQCVQLQYQCATFLNVTGLCDEVRMLHREIVLKDPKTHFESKAQIPLGERLYELIHAANDTCLGHPIVNAHGLPYQFLNCDDLATWAFFCWTEINSENVYEACMRDLAHPSFYKFGMRYLPDVDITYQEFTSSDDLPLVDLASNTSIPFESVSNDSDATINTGTQQRKQQPPRTKQTFVKPAPKPSGNADHFSGFWTRKKRWAAWGCGYPIISFLEKIAGGECEGNIAAVKPAFQKMGAQVAAVQNEVRTIENMISIVHDQSDVNAYAIQKLAAEVAEKFSMIRIALVSLTQRLVGLEKSVLSFQCTSLTRQQMLELQQLWISFKIMVQQVLTDLRQLPQQRTAAGVAALTWTETTEKLSRLLSRSKLQPVRTSYTPENSNTVAFDFHMYLPTAMVVVESYYDELTVDILALGKYPVKYSDKQISEVPPVLQVIQLTPLYLRAPTACYVSVFQGTFVYDETHDVMVDAKCLEQCHAINMHGETSYLCPRHRCMIPTPFVPGFAETNCSVIPRCPVLLVDNKYWISQHMQGQLHCLSSLVQYVSYEAGTIIELPCNCAFWSTNCPTLSNVYHCQKGLAAFTHVFVDTQKFSLDELAVTLNMSISTLRHMQVSQAFLNTSALSEKQTLLIQQKLYDMAENTSTSFWTQIKEVTSKGDKAFAAYRKIETINNKLYALTALETKKAIDAIHPVKAVWTDYIWSGILSLLGLIGLIIAVVNNIKLRTLTLVLASQNGQAAMAASIRNFYVGPPTLPKISSTTTIPYWIWDYQKETFVVNPKLPALSYQLTSTPSTTAPSVFATTTKSLLQQVIKFVFPARDVDPLSQIQNPNFVATTPYSLAPQLSTTLVDDFSFVAEDSISLKKSVYLIVLITISIIASLLIGAIVLACVLWVRHRRRQASATNARYITEKQQILLSHGKPLSFFQFCCMACCRMRKKSKAKKLESKENQPLNVLATAPPVSTARHGHRDSELGHYCYPDVHDQDESDAEEHDLLHNIRTSASSPMPPMAPLLEVSQDRSFDRFGRLHRQQDRKVFLSSDDRRTVHNLLDQAGQLRHQISDRKSSGQLLNLVQAMSTLRDDMQAIHTRIKNAEEEEDIVD